MEVVILGCGSSCGLPNIRLGFGLCDANNPKNRRTRSCLYFHDKDTSILFDTPPELRMQLYDNHIDQIDALIYTHMHADHVMGIDDARIFTLDIQNKENVKTLPVYIHEKDQNEFEQRFNFYLHPFNYLSQNNPPFALNMIRAGQTFQIKNLSLYPIAQDHGSVETLGFRTDNFAYTTDLKEFINFDVKDLRGIKLWVLGCVTPYESFKHVNLQTAIEWFDIVKPERMILTHLGVKMDYDTVTAQLPKGMELAYDGMRINL